MDVNKHNNSIGELLDMAVARAVPVVVALTDADLDRPTPCSQYDVKGLLNHLLHVVVEFQKLTAKKGAGTARRRRTGWVRGPTGVSVSRPRLVPWRRRGRGRAPRTA
ncbi:maleylpyruvate isomerase N-terminal domain-containing protein [Streptomyces sp. NPDC005548]|uniref:maleylpyruvate isomerase N-terminal domain-containing protein n=1 Tax=Streptomyces sp. NPDC005548 TaxID=3364724 RepID=UPI0036A9A132